MLTIRVLLRRLLVVPGVLALVAFFAAPLRDADPWLLDDDPRIAPTAYYETQTDARLTAADAVVTGASFMHRVLKVETADVVNAPERPSNLSLTAWLGAETRADTIRRLQERAPVAVVLIALAALTPIFAMLLIVRGASTSGRDTPTPPAVFLAISMFATAALLGSGDASTSALTRAWSVSWGGVAWIWLSFALVALLTTHYFVTRATRRAAQNRR